MNSLVASFRIVAFSMLICVAGYASIIFGYAQIVSKEKAEGSLIKDQSGNLVGSHLVAQHFSSPEYFWPRPSAVDYDGSAAGGSNKSPTSNELRKRGKEIIAQYGATERMPLPAELATASGSGLDPHLTEQAALYQVGRIANARGVAAERVSRVVRENSFVLGRFITEERLVNVLELNIRLDRAVPSEG